MQSLLAKLEKLRSDITEIMDEIRNQDQEDKPVEARGLHFESKLYDNMAETLYMNPDQRNTYIKSLWDTFSTEQQKTLLQNALCNHETIPDWMVVRQQPVL